MSEKLLRYGVLIDLAILIALSIDVYFTYQNYKLHEQRGQ
jgi:hypothetical protein